MSDWKIKHKSEILSFTEVFSLGLAKDPSTYTIENDRGDQRQVKSYSKDNLGKRIADGEFD